MVNTHLNEDEMKALIEHGVWPKDKQVFCPLQPSTSGYPQVRLPPRRPGLAGPGEVGHRSHIAPHIVAAIMEMRWLREPAMERLTPTQVQSELEHGYEASHLLSNIEPASMGMSPHFMTLEPGRTNRNRFSCSTTHAFKEYLAKHKSDPCNVAEKFKRFKKEENLVSVSTSYTKFKCQDPTMHVPECKGWDFSKGAPRLPAHLVETWGRHKARKKLHQQKKNEQRAREMKMTNRQRVQEKIKGHKKDITKLQSMLRAMRL